MALPCHSAEDLSVPPAAPSGWCSCEDCNARRKVFCSKGAPLVESPASEASAKKRSVLLTLYAEPSAAATRGPHDRHFGAASPDPHWWPRELPIGWLTEVMSNSSAGASQYRRERPLAQGGGLTAGATSIVALMVKSDKVILALALVSWAAAVLSGIVWASHGPAWLYGALLGLSVVLLFGPLRREDRRLLELLMRRRGGAWPPPLWPRVYRSFAFQRGATSRSDQLHPPTASRIRSR